jgi:hypothetical protein
MDDARDPGGTEGRVERIYWRGEEPWIRLRTRDGLWRSIPWQDTDLPRLTPHDFPQTPRLSPLALLALARHVRNHGALASRTHPKPSSR